MYASTHDDADALYFGKVAVPDAFIAFGVRRRRIAVVSRLEFSRVVRESRFDVVLPLEQWARRVADEADKAQAGVIARIIRALAREYDVQCFTVPQRFPAGLAFELKSIGVGLTVADGMLFPERACKDDSEAAAIREGNDASAAGFKVVEKVLRAATIRNGKLHYEGRYLTSERLQTLIGIACLERGAIAADTIVAGGDQACDPHCRGSGVLRANELIIVDIFPRVGATGYHGDMTRTYLKGRASEAQRKLVRTVFDAQQWAIGEHRVGASGKRVYDGVVKRFEAAGYRTETRDGVSVGFFHGLGHGLGLEVHEPPRVNASGERMKVGHVITVEPGLYYPGLGGCRIEDVVRITRDGPELLSKHPYRWEFR